jgi:peptide/nickel transport system substrate-binding protein/oligopeptide transport system substrate-binding protein
MNYGENSSPTAALQQQAQQQMAQADTDMNASQRTQRYQQAEQQIVNDVGWIPMTQETSTFLRSSNIVGIVDNAENIIPPDDWANIYRVQ